MTQRQQALFDNHKDTASLMCGAGEVFWVLDLEDTHGFALAVALESDQANANTHVTESRDAILSTDCIPAQTARTTYLLGRIMLRHGWKTDLPAPEDRYIVIVSAGRILVAIIPPFTTSKNQ